MTEVKKEEPKKEEIKQPEVKLPQSQYVILGDLIVYTDKGMCMWLSPTGMTLEENIKYLQYGISKYQDQIEINKKKAEEEGRIEPASENKDKKAEYKPV